MKKGNNEEYSREIYEETSEKLAELELDLATTPEGGESQVLEREISLLRARLKGLLTIAHKEAIQENIERELAALKPELDRALERVNSKLTALGDRAPHGLLRFGEDAKAEIEKTRRIALGKERPLPTIPFIEELLNGVSEAYSTFIQKADEWLGGQDRYGNDRGSQPV